MLVGLLFVVGCSHQSVRHLVLQPWQLNEARTLDLRYWRFDYTATPDDDRFVVQGTAVPRADALPKWVDTLEELWVVVYLADAEGRVLAKDVQVFDPTPPDVFAPREFSLALVPDDVDAGPLFITFGYRMSASGVKVPATGDTPSGNTPSGDTPSGETASANAATGDVPGRTPFYANESALSRSL